MAFDLSTVRWDDCRTRSMSASGRIVWLKHGASYRPEYNAYRNANRRCTNPEDKSWANYGGRGIRFLFTSFEQFLAELGPRPTPQHSVDRKDNNGNYEPGNVQWATKKEQGSNRRPRRRKS